MPKPDTNEAVAIASALRPTVDEWERESSRSCVRMKKMTVASTYDTSTRTMGVREAFSATAQNIPCVPGMRGADVGDPVWVQWLYGDKSTMCVVGPGDVSEFYDGGVNPNLLDNWYWMGGGSQTSGKDTLPINQRGAASYSSYGYCIDRWKIDGGITATLLGSCVEFKNTDTSTRYIRQNVPFNEPWPFYKFVTGSILFVDGTLLSGTVYPNSNSQTSNYQNWYFFAPSWGGFALEIPPSGNNYFTWLIRLYAGQTIRVAAVKTEIGRHQTLAYYDRGDARWKTREIPSFDEQLIKCLYYYQTYPIYFTQGYLTSSNTQYVMSLYLDAPIHKNATMTAGTVTARRANGGYSSVYTSAGVSFQNAALQRRSWGHYNIVDTRSSASSDTNNSTFSYTIRNLVLKYDL